MPLPAPIILASASPRRQQLLRDAGIEFVVRPADLPEIPQPNETPVEFARRMAREKALSIRPSSPNYPVLAADTVVAVDDEILGKPTDAEDAVRMLRLLSGRMHQVTTGVCLIADGIEDVRSATTTVDFSPIPEAEICAYVAGGEPMDKAGAYAIQGGAAKWVRQVEGDYNNVVGLPLELVREMLRRNDRT